jgi:hypothetical protein
VADPKLEKSLQVTRTLLSRAKAALPPPALEAKVEFAETLAEYEGVLSHNELELALDALEHAGSLVAARCGFWRDLERAAKNMGLIERASQFHRRFREARESSSSNGSWSLLLPLLKLRTWRHER